MAAGADPAYPAILYDTSNYCLYVWVEYSVHMYYMLYGASRN